MQLTLSRHELKEAVAGFTKIIPNKVTLPILACVKFESDDKNVIGYGTDLDQTARFTFTDNVCDERGVFTAGLSQLRDLSRGPDGDKIQFVTTGKDKLTVMNPVGGQTVRLELPAMDPDEWPAQAFSVKTEPTEDFLSAFQRLAPFASTDDTRYVLKSCYLDVADGRPGGSYMAATDGRRLTVRNTMSLPLKESCVVPTTKFLSWIKGTSRIGVTRQGEVKLFCLETGPWTYMVKAIDATYPNFKQVIPSDPGDNRITFAEDVVPFRQILKALPDEDEKGAVVLRAGQSGTLVVCSNGSDGKEVSVELPACTFAGKTKQYGVNRYYLIDALDAGFRAFSFFDELCPLVSDDGKGAKHVLMPMRIDSVGPAAEEDTPEKAETRVHAEPMSVNEHTKPKPKGAKMSKTDTAIEKLQTAYETAKDKIKEASNALAELAGLIKEAAREDRQRRNEIDNVRSSLASIRNIKI